MYRIALAVWLLAQTLASAETLEFTAAERDRVSSASGFSSLPPALQRRVANNTLAWMTETSAHVLSCWAQFGGPDGVVVEPKPAPALVRRTRETCGAALSALSANAGPSPRTSDMALAVLEFQQASRAVVDSAIRALETGGDDSGRARAISQFNAYYRMLAAGRLPLWMLRAAAETDETAGEARRA